MRVYERLSEVYDPEWGDFAARFAGLVERVLEERGIGEGKILDLGCGTGILAMALAGLGHRVLGLDRSPEMISVARAKSAGRPRVAFAVQDMRDFEAGKGYDLISCSFDALNYIVRPGELASMFARVAAALADSGVFVFDSNTTRQYLDSRLGRREIVIGGRRVSQAWVYDPLRRRATTTFTFENGSREVHRQRPYDCPEIRCLLGRAGLRLAGAWSSPEGEPFREESPRLYAAAENG